MTALVLARTLDRYLARRFLLAILGLCALVAGLVFLFDVLELIRRNNNEEGFTVARIVVLSLLRVPLLAEQALPFAVLFGAILAFAQLSRSLELVVARAGGQSVWSFTRPPLLLALAIGIVASTIYNPLAVRLDAWSDAFLLSLGASPERLILGGEGDVWLRQRGGTGESILRATSRSADGTLLSGVTAFVFEANGMFRERIEALTAELKPGQWALSEATVISHDTNRQKLALYGLETSLTPTEVREAIAEPEAIDFWELPHAIELAERAGLAADRYRLQYHVLMARPLLLASMVLIAAVVSLRLSRFGGTTKMVLGGIAAGFLLYIFFELIQDLGGTGLVPAWIAAWSPGTVGILLGTTLLLYQEDG